MTNQIENLWDEGVASEMDGPQLLQYRSNLLGSDLRVTNFGGGNTSAKLVQKDLLTDSDVDVLWVKGSGGDLGSIQLSGFSTLYLDKLKALPGLYRGLEHEDEMVGYLPHATFNLNPRAASIDTPLHAYIPHAHVDHMHPDSVIAIACSENSKHLTETVFEGRLGWLPWQRPGFDLGLKLGEIATSNPDLEGVVLAGHGLFTWGDSSKSCYDSTIRTIDAAAKWLAANNRKEAFGGIKYDGLLERDERLKVAAALMPAIRGRITDGQYKVGHFNDDPAMLEFVNSNRLDELAALGTSCPDHFLRTKICPLVIDFDPSADDLEKEVEGKLGGLDELVANYRQSYADYYERCKRDSSPAMRDPNAVVYLVPGVGMITFAKDKATARIAGEFYINAVNVMRESDGVDAYVGLDEQEAFDIEYWLLEEAKLQRMPKAKPMAGRVAFITGGAGGIGSATASRMLSEGACVVLADIDEGALEDMKSSLQAEYSKDVVRAVKCDVTSEESVQSAFSYAATEFGGVDVLVSNAGIASSSPLEETSLGTWNKNMNILATGYFLVSREGFKLMKDQNTGGAVVFVVSKNGLVASPGAAAYCTAKGAEIQLARSVALEGAPLGIRCNVVNPDAVLRGSKIWNGGWKKERAAAYSMTEVELEDHYRQRSLLKRSVFPSDVAEAVYFLASEQAAKSTGNIINVDAGHAPSFTR